jgi:molybdopterin adenylyltransferase
MRVEARKRKKMSSSTPKRSSAAVVTISDSSSQGTRVDRSGQLVAEALAKKKFQVVAHEVVPDDVKAIRRVLLRLTRKARFIVTTGGTGIAPRDVTPEATRTVCDRLLEGISERMRSEGMKKTPFAALSRGICGVRGKCLILNLPGSPAGAVESLEAVIDLMPHALDLLSGKTRHAPRLS